MACISEISFVTERLGFPYTFRPHLHFVYKVQEFRCVSSLLQVIENRVTSDQLYKSFSHNELCHEEKQGKVLLYFIFFSPCIFV